MAKWVKELRWMRHVIARSDHEMRLDRWLRQQFPLAPQSLLQAQLRKRKIRLVAPPSSSSISSISENGRRNFVPDATQAAAAATTSSPGKAHSVLLEGFTVVIDAHLFQNTLQHAVAIQENEKKRAIPPPPSSPKKLPLLPELLQRVVYKDSNYFILDKPHGLAVQEGTRLESSLADYLPAIAEAFGGSRSSDTLTCSAPRLVHRLDKETSGLLVLARNRLAAAKFAALLQNGKVRKTYQALVSAPSTRQQKQAFEAKLTLFQGEISSPVDGKEATTLVKPLPTDLDSSKTQDAPRGVWLELSPVTGRKHQLRVHCAHVLNAPIVGDTKYRGPRADRLYLHAQRITFPNPFGSEKQQDQDQDPRRRLQPREIKIDIQRAIGHTYPARDAK